MSPHLQLVIDEAEALREKHHALCTFMVDAAFDEVDLFEQHLLGLQCEYMKGYLIMLDERVKHHG